MRGNRLTKTKEKIVSKLTKLKNWFTKKNNVCELLLFSSLAIIFFTTLSLNIYIAMYLLAAILFGLAIAIFKLY
ncbi:hypothetical protein [Clostridium sp.]|uniref:hypothetical protein n=1 Tax=Clostridium sp. TaxID=1506 RepID=UPI0028FFE76D|nr:hypothetical protein [Clostridium sp.]MDU1968853.1 hypothetical protein [Clostridium perfringens]MDU1822395.1 hypothetical protein [Clostridium sp.]MDU1841561.1 hypothetical protein [Clostridium sp.]MDU2689627.1 hypothetical protein [Clostridium sp.]MDU2955810.1 hypothetical protein [Clostridium sp.]